MTHEDGDRSCCGRRPCHRAVVRQPRYAENIVDIRDDWFGVYWL